MIALPADIKLVFTLSALIFFFKYNALVKSTFYVLTCCFCLLNAQELSVSLEMIYGQVCEVNDSEEVFEQFLKWKHAKIEEFIDIRNNTDAALQTLTDLFSGILKVKQTSLIFPLPEKDEI